MQDITSSIYTFEDLRNSDKLYVDKTEYIWKMVSSSPARYFLSRPRRFGKSLTLSTLKAVFQGKRELFKGLAIYDKPYDWKSYPVIHLDMNGRDYSSLDAVVESLQEIILDQARVHGVVLERCNPVNMFQKLVVALAEKSTVVVLVDEYDKPILSNLTETCAQDVLRVLKAFYSVIKARDSEIYFAFVTGVTKFCHVSLFSDLNNLLDMTTMPAFATMLGYTQKELEANFSEWIETTCADNQMPRQEFLDMVKSWYDGYRFCAKAETVYNPVSLAQFFTGGGQFGNYWFSTGTPTFLMELIKKRRLDLSGVTSQSVSTVVFDAFEIDDVDPVCLLLQTGYLTIHAVETKYGTNRYQLDFPNREVSESFNTYLLHALAQRSKNDTINFCDRLSDALQKGDIQSFQKAMEVFFAGIPYDVHHKDEANFQNIFFAIFRLLGYDVLAESRTCDGRVDAVVETETDVYLFEFKLDGDGTVLAQMREKEYFKPYLLSPKRITLVGANFDTRTGRIAGWADERLK